MYNGPFITILVPGKSNALQQLIGFLNSGGGGGGELGNGHQETKLVCSI